ncbi:hypothetical protein [Streptomyces olivoreticuli]|uniref:hypothetical protein n=1 Tax=Streptomyces olivoreticuli TaxID=68246 RepID=UPI000E223364|nr:hypothetical protein [Streptomyces olivoreticuli]
MADDHRYEWLDDDAVERLLTPAQSPSADPEAAEERRLAALLRSLTPAQPCALPGEEAALAAFRAARAERTRDAHAFAEETAPGTAPGGHATAVSLSADTSGAGRAFTADGSGMAHGPAAASASEFAPGADAYGVAPSAADAPGTGRAFAADGPGPVRGLAAASASEGAPGADAHGLIPGATPSVTDATGPARTADGVSVIAGRADAPATHPLAAESGPAAAAADARAARIAADVAPTSGLAATAASASTTRVTPPGPVARIGVVERARGLFGQRWRPVKVAVAMAVAGCALGGVAVAAGTGVLSAPFGRTTSEPETSTSVSALDDTGMATPLPPSGTPGPSPSPGKDGNSRPSGSPYTPAPKGGGATTGHGGKEDGPGGGPSATPRRDGGGHGDDDGDTAKRGSDWAARMCRDFLAAQQHPGQGVDEHDLRDLEHVVGAAGADALRAYCERHASDGGSKSAPGKGGDDGKAKGGDDGDGGHRGRPTGLLPPVLGGPGLQLPKVLPVPLTPLV